MSAPLGAVLAGGRSRRMGQPKALLDVGGQPLIARPLAALRAAGLEAVVVAKAASPLPPGLGVPVWHEPDEPRHPLTGLVHALERAGRPVVALACDLPGVTGELVARLAARDDPVVVARADERLHPLCARYDPVVLPALRRALAAEAPLVATLAALDPVVLEVEPHLVANVNTPEDLRRTVV